MRRGMTAALAGLLLVLSPHFTAAAEATVEDVNRVLASGKPVVLIGAPAEFISGDVNGDAACTQSDWGTYLNEWIDSTANKKKLKVMIVSGDVLIKALQTPNLNKDACFALFVRNKSEALFTDNHDSCIIASEEYDVGAKWLEGSASAQEIAKNGFKKTAVVARTAK